MLIAKDVVVSERSFLRGNLQENLSPRGHCAAYSLDCAARYQERLQVQDLSLSAIDRKARSEKWKVLSSTYKGSGPRFFSTLRSTAESTGATGWAKPNDASAITKTGMRTNFMFELLVGSSWKYWTLVRVVQRLWKKASDVDPNIAGSVKILRGCLDDLIDTEIGFSGCLMFLNHLKRLLRTYLTRKSIWWTFNAVQSNGLTETSVRISFVFVTKRIQYFKKKSLGCTDGFFLAWWYGKADSAGGSFWHLKIYSISPINQSVPVEIFPVLIHGVYQTWNKDPEIRETKSNKSDEGVYETPLSVRVWLIRRFVSESSAARSNRVKCMSFLGSAAHFPLLYQMVARVCKVFMHLWGRDLITWA